MPPVKRRYHAPVREEQAAQTRQRIAVAAAAEFAEHGWVGTTVAAIAARAQVTPQAVHLSVGGKAALLIRAVEVAVASATGDIYGRAARLFLVLQDAAAGDAAAAELAGQASARRLADHRHLAGLLVPDAGEDKLQLLTDTIWVLAGPAVYVDLVHRRSWPPGQYADWLACQLGAAVQAARRPGPAR